MHCWHFPHIDGSCQILSPQKVCVCFNTCQLPASVKGQASALAFVPTDILKISLSPCLRSYRNVHFPFSERYMPLFWKSCGKLDLNPRILLIDCCQMSPNEWSFCGWKKIVPGSALEHVYYLSLECSDSRSCCPSSAAIWNCQVKKKQKKNLGGKCALLGLTILDSWIDSLIYIQMKNFLLLFNYLSSSDTLEMHTLTSYWPYL